MGVLRYISGAASSAVGGAHHGSSDPKAMMTTRTMVFLLGLALVASACGPEFPPYNEIDDFRVLAIRADKPWLPPGEETVLDALVFVEDPAAEVTYRWEWCPITEGASNGHRCVITQEDLEEALNQASEDPNIPNIAIEPFGTACSIAQLNLSLKKGQKTAALRLTKILAERLAARVAIQQQN